MNRGQQILEKGFNVTDLRVGDLGGQTSDSIIETALIHTGGAGMGRAS